MEMQPTRFMAFTLNFWIDYQKFKGVSKISAVFLNFFLLLFKLVFCGVGLLIMAPHLAANYLLSKEVQSIPQRILRAILYVISVLVSLILDIPVLLITLIGIVGCVSFIPDILTNPLMILPAGVFGAVAVIFGKFALLCVGALFSKTAPESANDDEVAECEEEEEEVEGYQIEDDVDELVFCQLFAIGPNMSLLIDHVEMCPDETAFIRVVDEEGYTPLYKRKVRRDKRGSRYIQFNSTNHYLDDKKTQPVITKK